MGSKRMDKTLDTIKAEVELEVKYMAMYLCQAGASGTVDADGKTYSIKVDFDLNQGLILTVGRDGKWVNAHISGTGILQAIGEKMIHALEFEMKMENLEKLVPLTEKPE